jgi:hypothetical protein
LRRLPSQTWAIAELLLAIAIMFAGLEGYLLFTSTPYLLAVGAAFLWWRGPGWRAIGLRRPDRWSRALAVGAGLSTYQFASLYLVEPLVARLTTGELPDSGLLFGAAYLTSGRNLWVAILAHGLTDTIGFVMIYLGVYPGI